MLRAWAPSPRPTTRRAAWRCSRRACGPRSWRVLCPAETAPSSPPASPRSPRPRRLGPRSPSPPMGRIADDLREFMRSLRFRDPVVPIVANIDALPKLRAADIPEALAKHLSTRVEWLRSVRFMLQQNVSTFVELGAGQVVNGLVKRIAEQAALHNVSDPQSLAGTLRALA